MKRHLLPLVIVLVPLAATVLWAWTPRTVPPERVSDLYRRYAGNPHLTVAYIEDFPLNDTIAVDVTVLTATDDEGWDALARDFDIPVLPEMVLSTMGVNEDFILTFKMEEGNMDQYVINGVCRNDVISFSYKKHIVSVFKTETEKEQKAVLNYNIKQSIKQKNK